MYICEHFCWDNLRRGISGSWSMDQCQQALPNSSSDDVLICKSASLSTSFPILVFFFISVILSIVLAPHSSTLAWKIPWTEEPGRLQSMGLRRVRHNWATSLSLFPFMHWRRKWQPTPVFLPGESQGRGSLVGCHLWGHIESDTTKAT